MARKSRKNIPSEIKFTSSLDKVYNVGIYVRLSFIDKNKKCIDNDSIENQKNAILNYMENKEEFNLVQIYEDANKTGTNFQRSGFEKLLEDIKNQKINCIIVKDLSRFGRNYIECGNYLEKVFPFMGVRFIAINDNYDSNNENSNEILLMHLKNFVNEIYAKDISKKITTIIREKQKKGDFIGNFAPYGYLRDPYNKNKIIVNEETAPIVRYIFNLRLENYGYTKIAKILNEKNILSQSAYLYKNGYVKSDIFKDKKWTIKRVREILLNPIYIGCMVQGKSIISQNKKRVYLPMDKWIIVENMHEPIIDKDTFYKVQQINNKFSDEFTMNNLIDNIFKGYIKCGECGRNLTTNRNKRSNGKIVNYFICRGHRIGICDFISIKEELIKEVVFNEVKNQIKIAINLKNLITENYKTIKLEENKLINEINYLNNEIEKIKNFYEIIYEDYITGLLDENDYIFNKNSYIEKEQTLLKNKSTLEIKLQELKDNFINENNYIKTFLQFRNKKILSKELLETLIENIIIYKDKTIQINFKYMSEYNIINNKIGEILNVI